MNPLPPEQAALWHMIRENPHDDAPRLIYSDWLEENDQAERAEFIRRHIADYHAIREGVTDEAMLSNRIACRKLFQDHQLEWWNPAHRALEHFPFSRGFPSPEFRYSALTAGWSSFRQMELDYVWSVPEWHLIRGSTFSPRNLTYDASHSSYRSIISLELCERPRTQKQLSDFFNSPNFTNLWRLSFGMYGDSTSYLKILFNSPLPEQLRELNIGPPASFSHQVHRASTRFSLDIDKFESLAQNTRFPNLHSLRIGEYGFDDESFRRIDRIIPTKTLSVLNLRGNRIGPEGLKCFVNDDSPRLRQINLSHNAIGDEGAMLIAKSPSMSRVKYLNLNSTGIGPIGLRALLDSPILQHATFCILNENPGWSDPKIEARFKEWQKYAKTYIA